MSIRNRIVVVDYGMGNIHSIESKIFTKFCLKFV